MGFSRQEYWSGLPFPSLRNLSDLGIKPGSLMSPVLAGGFFTSSVYMSIPISQFLQSPFPLGIQTFVLYICVSISALQMRSSL